MYLILYHLFISVNSCPFVANYKCFMEDRAKNEVPFHSGFVSIIGRPNVGKSTLLNVIIGEKIAAVSEKPSTTRNRILGIKNLPDAQLIFLDTPGIHKARGELGRIMVKTATAAVSEADVLLVMIEVDLPFGKGDRFVIESLHKPVILLINKIDRVKKSEVLRIMAQARELGNRFLEVIPISALYADGIDVLINTIIKYLPEGPKYFPDDMITDQPERILAAEIIREKVFNLTHEEIPYCSAVVIEEFKDDPKKNLFKISAVIYVEKDSQKGIIIGKGGKMAREIGRLARFDLERILGTKVYLQLWVKVRENWTKRADLIRGFGYGVDV